MLVLPRAGNSRSLSAGTLEIRPKPNYAYTKQTMDLLGKIAYFLIQSIRLETIGPRGESIQPATAKVDT